MPSATITTKGQITTPKNISNILNIGKGDGVNFLVDTNGSVTILPVTTDIKVLKGLVPKPKKYVALDDMKNAIRKRVAAFAGYVVGRTNIFNNCDKTITFDKKASKSKGFSLLSTNTNLENQYQHTVFQREIVHETCSTSQFT